MHPVFTYIYATPLLDNFIEGRFFSTISEDDTEWLPPICYLYFEGRYPINIENKFSGPVARISGK